MASAVALAAAAGCSGSPSPGSVGSSGSHGSAGPSVATSTGTQTRTQSQAPTGASTPRGQGRPTHAGPRPPLRTPQGPASGAPAPPRVDPGLRRLLDRRARAVADDDRRAWLATLSGQADPSLRGAQAQAFTGLQRLPVTDLRYTVAGRPGQAAPGSGGAERVRVQGRYSLAGYWTAPRTFEQVLTVRPSARARGSRLLDVADGPGERQVWQLPDLQVQRTAHVLLAGNVPHTQLRAYRRLTEQAVGDVATVWGGGWPGRVVVVVPRSAADFRALSGLPTKPGRLGIADVAAVTVGPVAQGHPAGADEVVVNPGAYAELRPEGRRVVLLHEVTHVATRATTTAAVPLWLSEGFAEYVAWSTVDLPTEQVAPELLEQVRAGNGPTGLPGPGPFDSSAPDATRAYHEGWLYCRYLAERFGADRLVTFYRAAAAAPGHGDRSSSASARSAAAAEQVFGLAQGRLVRDWLRWLDELARHAT